MLISSIDLQKGKAVQLRQGREKVLEENQPLELAKTFARYGKITVIDLDGAFGKGENTQTVKELCQRYECIVGGGIRSIEKAREVYSYGAEKIIVGSSVFSQNEIQSTFVEALGKKIGKKQIIVSLDVLDGFIMIHGWKVSTNLRLEQAIQELDTRVGGYLITSISHEGMMKGMDQAFIRKARELSELPIIAAGGISSISEIQELDKMGIDAQVGMALYTGVISPQEAFLACMDWEKMNLIPVNTFDSYGQLLMTAYMSKVSLQKSFETGLATYFSRSRQSLWTKGQESGNTQEIMSIRRDCDGDALKMIVRQKGYACHRGSYSCYGEQKFSLPLLLDILKKRISEKDPSSYTASLDSRTLRQKIIEEAGEVILAEKRNDKVWEVADLLYFINAYMAQENIEWNEVLNELQRKRRLK